MSPGYSRKMDLKPVAHNFPELQVESIVPRDRIASLQKIPQAHVSEATIARVFLEDVKEAFLVAN